MVTITYAVKTSNLCTIARDTYEGWRETFEFAKSQGVEIKAKPFSDYMGETITSDQIIPYHFGEISCPVIGPKWLF